MPQQPTITGRSGRIFPTYPAAVLAFIVDEQERILMLSNPKSGGAWEVINGGMDAGETIIDAVLREVNEEAGPHIKVTPLGFFHAYSFAYDPDVPYMLSMCCLLAYQGGEVVPGDDMTGSEIRWVSVDEVADGSVTTIAPRDTPLWTFKRAIECYRLWKDNPPARLQPEIDHERARPKYQK